jgi:hypothetical protein
MQKVPGKPCPEACIPEKSEKCRKNLPPQAYIPDFFEKCPALERIYDVFIQTVAGKIKIIPTLSRKNRNTCLGKKVPTLFRKKGYVRCGVRHFGEKGCMYYQEACNTLRFFTYIPVKGGQIGKKICMYRWGSLKDRVVYTHWGQRIKEK